MRLTNQAIFNKSLPWLMALIYVLFIGSLGWVFHQIDIYKIDHINIIDPAGSIKPVKLGYFQTIENHPDSVQLSLSFEVPEDGSNLAVFLPRLSSDARISVNRQLLRLERVSHKARHTYRPLLVPIPDQVLNRQESNELDIQLQAHGPVMVLSKFYLGPRVQLESVHRYFYFFRHDLILSTFAITLLVTVFIGTIWLVRPQFNEYGWLALAFLAFNYFLFSFILDSEPARSQLYTWSYLLARAIFFWAFLIFIHRFMSLHRRWIDYGVGVIFAAVFGVGLLLILGGNYSNFISLTFFTSLPMILIIITYISVVLLLRLLNTGHIYLHWLLVGSLFALLLGIHDIFVLFDLQHWLVRDFYISHYAILFITIGYGGVLVHRVARALFNSEDLNLELNRLLKLKTQELEKAAEQQLQHEKQLTLYAERQRIMADMHDGVGGQLVGLIAANRNSPMQPESVNQELDQILADLRLVLDALSPAGEELITALARLRERYSPLLRHANIDLHWSIDPDIDSIPMPPGLTINALRLVQEAIQNSIKHARADNIWLKLEPVSNGYRLSIIDDGIGIKTEAAASGHGRQTMLQRAMALNGQLEIISPTSGGTQVTLTFPAPAAA